MAVAAPRDEVADGGFERAVMGDLLEVGVTLGGCSGVCCAGYAVAVLGLAVSRASCWLGKVTGGAYACHLVVCKDDARSLATVLWSDSSG